MVRRRPQKCLRAASVTAAAAVVLMTGAVASGRQSLPAFASPALWRRPPCVLRGGRCCLGRGEEERATGADPVSRADARWAALQEEADAKGLTAGELRGQATLLLVEAALARLRLHAEPARPWNEEPPDLGGVKAALWRPRLPFATPPPGLGNVGFGSGAVFHKELREALKAFLGEDSRYITEFLAESATMSAVHEAFWQAQLYLENLSKEPEDAAVQDTLQRIDAEIGDLQDTLQRVEAEIEAHNQAHPTSQELHGELSDSLIMARQTFVSSASFGYFLRRCRARLALERLLQGTAESRGLEAYLAGVGPKDMVELARPATQEAASALELRADMIFGSFHDLLRSLEKMDITEWQAQRLTIEGAAFGAALFEAEEAAATSYSFRYSSFGSRHEDILGRWS